MPALLYSAHMYWHIFCVIHISENQYFWLRLRL